MKKILQTDAIFEKFSHKSWNNTNPNGSVLKHYPNGILLLPLFSWYFIFLQVPKLRSLVSHL
ncbi:hypothetical protein [Nostoc sp.]|uniref:hypothetical protein n=1 Tax=Nostoc sp. TaxID=1180 RepID=UPI002FF504BC